MYIYKKRPASKEIFPPSNKIHREVGQPKDLPAPVYICIYLYMCIYMYIQIYIYIKMQESHEIFPPSKKYIVK
jgi:hypothetical protein